VNIGSVSGLHGIRHQAVYSASKFGLEGFADSLNQELVERGIYLSTINPGGIDTPLWDERSNPYPGDTKDKLLQVGTIVEMVLYVAELPRNVLLKKIVAFPINEWH
jgi:short-subunit dehydrogenase